MELVNQIILGNAFELIKKVPDGSVDLILTSPPYGIGKEYEKRSETIEEYMAAFQPMVAECVRVLKNTGSIAWEIGNWINRDGNGRSIVPLEYPYFEAFSKLGMVLRNRIVWIHRTTAYNGSKKIFTPSHESILWLTKSDDYAFNLTENVLVKQKDPMKVYHVLRGGIPVIKRAVPEGIDPGDVWDIPFGSNSSERWDHPAQFPEALARKAIDCFSNSGDIVLDPFAGVATTLKVAKDLGRKYLGFEKEPHYYNQAVLRLNGIDQKGQLSIGTDFDSVKKQLVFER